MSRATLEDVQEESDQATPLKSGMKHSREHSRIHARNLSEFFPRPGQSPGRGYGGTYEDPHSRSIDSPSRTTDISSPAAGGGGTPTSPRAQNRRGHHHRHSVSHNLFPFLDPSSPGSQSNASFSAASPTKPPFHSLSSPSASASEPFLAASHSSFRQRFGFLPLILQLPLYSLLRLPFPSSQFALLIAFTQMSLGATLWIQGQAGESLSVTGLGYLVVFDGLGTISKIVLGNGGGLDQWRIEMGRTSTGENLQQPYGLVRLSTLSHFSQAIYLLFSAVYVCKESIEHVLLLHGPLEDGTDGGGHGSGHGGVGHGEGRTGGGATSHAGGIEPIDFPVVVLILSAILAIVSSVCFQTHAELAREVQAATTTTTESRAKGKGDGSRMKTVLNPFTVTVAGFGIALTCAALVLPPAQLSTLDKILSLLVSLSMFYIAYPAAQSTGKVLLQTSPAKESKEARGIEQAFKDIENHPLVISIESPHVWQLVPSTTIRTLLSSSSIDPSPPTTTTVVTLTVLVNSGLGEKEVLEVSRWVEVRCRTAGNVSNGSGRIDWTEGPPGTYQGKDANSVYNGYKGEMLNPLATKEEKTHAHHMMTLFENALDAYASGLRGTINNPLASVEAKAAAGVKLTHLPEWGTE
ncbi:uncharacterized protein JCM6883_003999 [Sporobolomyces salmoneus]|uniref:uncharacterized protein n=1 Tax=Sporobolomyces salmoneus TaxID=183962 RepID=UPI0031736755